MALIKFDVTNRRSGAVQFIAEIECDEGTTTSVKLGLAIKWAIKARANLADANLADADLARADLARADLARADLARADLADANLARANLARADLARANLARAYLADQPIIDGGLRSDGHRFFLTNFEGEGLRIKAGCRNFAGLAEARKHWQDTRGGTALGDETFAILDHLERVAVGRRIIPAETEIAA